MSGLQSEACHLYHFPGCPFSERIEILVTRKGAHAIPDTVIDISAPRPAWLLAKTGGATALPALATPQGVLLESTAIMRFLDASLPGRRLAAPDPYRHAIEEMMGALAAPLSAAGYRMIQNRDPAARAALATAVDDAFGRIDNGLQRHATGHDFLHDDFGWAETLLTPTLKRLWFLEYYEDYYPPARLVRLHRWREACLAHPACQHRSREEIVKLYHDYAYGHGSGRVPPGRTMSSFAPMPHWSERPMPPRDKWGDIPDDKALGLIG